ncbi:MAG: DUF5110 domain-containing protein [Sedimentisphaerales bacterium]|nr:DUF5110 domain-containing protein [Sedimentisphaerales bacterium]
MKLVRGLVVNLIRGCNTLFMEKEFRVLKRFACIIIFRLLISSGFGEVLFEKDFSESISDDPAKAGILSDSLDFKFHQETGDRLWIKDYDAGVVYPLDPAVINPAVHPTLYLSFTLHSLNTTTQNKFAGVVLYQDGQEVFGLGNDWVSENFSFWSFGGNSMVIGDVPTPVDADVHKVVMRIDYDPDGPEEIRVGLDPFCRRSEARQPDHIWTTYEHELSFDEIRIRCGNNDCAWEFDDLRIGTDWASVTPSNDEPGAYIETITANPLPPGDAEMIHDGVARFWPSGVDGSEVLPSFALESPRSSIGPVSPSWELTPQFGTFDNRKYAYFDIPAEVDLYGTGEVTGSLLRNGYQIVLFNKDNYGYGKPDQLYQSHPWVLGLRQNGTAFGVIFDTPWQAQLSLRSGILFTIPEEAPSFPVMVIEGQNPQDVMVKLAELTGKMPMPPRWALGYHQCRYSYNPDARVRQIADTFRAKQIPCDVIWLDIDYMNGFRIFTFDPTQFPDPQDTNDYLHSLGFKSVWMIDPGVKYESGYFVYDSGTQADVWVKDALGNTFIGPVWPGDCVFPDFTIPAVRSWWSGLYGNFMSQGVDGIWNDMNEPAVFEQTSGWTMPLDNHHRGGGDLPAGPHRQYHNIYGMQMVRASRAGIKNANPLKRPFVLSRANFLGGHRYAATWTGDNIASWDHLKWSIPMSLNLSLSGQPFNGPDIGGFIGNAAPELWAHWISVGAFYPFSRAHTSKDTANQEPWEFGAETENAARIALQRRYRLMPYLYTAFRQSHEQGLPVMRPVLFADPTDISLRMEDQAFLIGEDVMVVPKWATDTHLPQGIWRSVSIVGEDAQTDQYQCDVKVRGGAIIPLGPIVQTTQEITTHPTLTLIVVLDNQGHAEGTLYEDAGEGYDYLQGEFCLSTFNAQKEGDRVVVKCTQQEGDLISPDRLATVAVIDDGGIHYGFGDICSSGGVSVMLALSAGWTNQDVGAVSAAGSSSGSGSIFTVTGSGADIEDSADEFQFAYRQITGNCEITARVVSQQNTNDWAKAGVMIRETLAAGSRHAMTKDSVRKDR